MTKSEIFILGWLAVVTAALIAVSIWASRVAERKPNLYYWCDVVEISPDFTVEEKELCRQWRARRKL